MATSLEFTEFVCEQIHGCGEIRYRKMFGEYMVYVNDKPILLICDDTVYVKTLDCISELMGDAEKGFPYEGAREHYILDIENRELALDVIAEIEPVTPVPVKKPRGRGKSR